MKITDANKAIIAGLASLTTALVATSADNVIDINEQQHLIVTLVTVVVGVWTVWRVPNTDSKNDDSK